MEYEQAKLAIHHAKQRLHFYESIRAAYADAGDSRSLAAIEKVVSALQSWIKHNEEALNHG